MKTNTEITAERLREVLNYNPETGIFTYKSRRNRVRVGEIAGNTDNDGYIRIMIDGVRYKAHRLAWLYVNGAWPDNELDHKDLNKSNNSITNLRQATRKQNQCNRAIQSNNKTGVKGVRWSRKEGKYNAQIQVNYRRRSLGFFDTLDDASEAYKSAALLLHGDFARV